MKWHDRIDRIEQTKAATSPVRLLVALGVALAAVYALAPPVPASAPELRPAAASRAVADPPGGAYWHTRALWAAVHPRLMGSGSNRYHVEVRHVSEGWITPGGKEWSGHRSLGARPKSAADRRAWRRDGSPTTWRRTADGRIGRLSSLPDKGSVGPTKGGPDVFFLADQQLSYEELQRLPADPAGLRAWIEKAVRTPRADPTANVPEEAVDEYVRGTLVTLYQLPVPRNVRVAAYRALPAMPGVHVRGKAKDALGRTGERLSFDHTRARGHKDTALRSEVIVDTGAMLLMAHGVRTTVGGKPFPNKTWTETMLHVGWTDRAPSVPALP
ncbi:hypothetical protein [Streptosporangium sp. NPDC023615]|uniref:hypothetical protein n=1 Tax=Streptosporangium sp. NPDC023615 TaxID=3154794 RepID=UPI003422B115